ncbi:MAG TPA: LysM peptidoglycan-binding domain-containing protein [Anaerolineales bacterium]|nr:LysM peptidoglycan-binding domain-containing protein [Anaerolineales bacterium]
MDQRRMLQALVVVSMVLALSLTPTAAGRAASGCQGYVMVYWGDTLSGMAAACGTTVSAIQAANPGMGSSLYAGQVIYMPAPACTSNVARPGGYPTYVVQPGDTLANIGARYGFSVNQLLAVNPQICNPNVIFVGQTINLPASGAYTPVPYPTYYPTAYPTAYPPPCTSTTPCYNPTPYPTYYVTPVPTSTGFGTLKVTYSKGLLVRTGPGTQFSEIVSPFVSAVKGTTWTYRKNSLTTDPTQFVWVEIQIDPRSGFSVGWILTRDSLGAYFTDPQLGAPIDPNDP